jgi:hypothetical protein
MSTRRGSNPPPPPGAMKPSPPKGPPPKADYAIMECSHCGEQVIPIDGVSAIWDRGYWWHTSCCSFFYNNGQPFVSFPSEGQLIPRTIMS